MAESSTDSGNLVQYLEEKKVHVCVCSCSQRDTVQGLIQQIEEDMTDVVESVRFKPLPYNIRDMNEFDFSGIDVLLLCHSIENRRFSLTDVTDALYGGFLPRARNYVGQSKVGVIVHDFPEEALTAESAASRMDSFRNIHETTIKSSSLVLIGGRLSQVPIQLDQKQLKELKQFFRFASSSPSEEVADVCMEWGCMFCVTCMCSMLYELLIGLI